MAFHECPECGLIHGDMSPQTNPEVEIARIQAESALKIAQLQARADKAVAELETEAEVDVAEAQAEAVVVALSAEEEASEEVPVDEDPGLSAPVVIATDIDAGNDDADELVPPHAEEHHESDESAPKPKKSGLGMW